MNNFLNESIYIHTLLFTFHINSILGANETQLTMKCLQIEQSKRNHLLLTINQRKDHLYPMKLHYDQLLVQLMKENGHIQVNNLIIPKSNRMSPLSPRCSYIPKEKSLHSISSLDENEIDEVRKKLDHFQSLLIQVKNQLNSSPNDEDDDGDMIDEIILPNTSTEVNLLQTTEKNIEENGEEIDDSCQKLPNYVTFSVKKSHEYAVRNWLLSNFKPI
ncbi:unnamed protein product [Schistosoma haematobium]|nr:unnamed protein product [Schistosoma haematobium]